jgi:hypothetical protein
LEQRHRPTEAKQHRKQTNFNNLNKDLGDSVVIDAFWLDSKVIECFNSVEKTDTGIIMNFLQEILDNASTRKVKVKGGFKYGI